MKINILFLIICGMLCLVSCKHNSEVNVAPDNIDSVNAPYTNNMKGNHNFSGSNQIYGYQPNDDSSSINFSVAINVIDSHHVTFDPTSYTFDHILSFNFYDKKNNISVYTYHDHVGITDYTVDSVAYNNITNIISYYYYDRNKYETQIVVAQSH